MSFSAALYTYIHRNKREYTLVAWRQAVVYCTVACTTPNQPIVGPHPPTTTLPCRALALYPFIWVSLSPSISVPTLNSAGLVRGQGDMGGRRVEGTLQKGSWKCCGLLPRNHIKKDGKRGWRPMLQSYM